MMEPEYEFVCDNELNAQEQRAILAAAEQGDAEAQHRWGMHLFLQGDDECALWLKKAAKQGHAGAMNDLGLMYMDGMVTRHDAKYGFMLFSGAAERGLVTAQYNLGLSYKAGDGVKRSKSKSFIWFSKAVAQGHPGALYEQACCYAQGFGVERDVELANKLLRKAMVAGSGEAMYEVASLVLHDSESSEDEKTAAVKLVCKATEYGSPAAMYFLARAYLDGTYGFPKDMEESEYWLDQVLISEPDAEDINIIPSSFIDREKLNESFRVRR